jgi:hypothetical protein
MGPDRLHQFPPTSDSPEHDMGLAIQPMLYPQYPRQQVLQNPAAFAKSSMFYHDSAIYIAAPLPGSINNNTIWKYDMRVGGWTQWTNIYVTSGRSMPPTNTGDGAQYLLYLYGLANTGSSSLSSSSSMSPTPNGANLFVMQGTQDQDTAVSVPYPINFSVTVQGLRPGYFYRHRLYKYFYRRGRAEYMELELVLNGSGVTTTEAANVGPYGILPIAGAKSIITYAFAGLGKGVIFNLPPGLIDGEVITVNISGAASDIAYLRGVRVFVSQTGIDFGQ